MTRTMTSIRHFTPHAAANGLARSPDWAPIMALDANVKFVARGDTPMETRHCHRIGVEVKVYAFLVMTGALRRKLASEWFIQPNS
jgi:hypothetical protein